MEDMKDGISRHKVEDLYTQTMVVKVMAASGKPKKITFNQAKFRKDLEAYYDGHKTDEIGDSYDYCVVTG